MKPLITNSLKLPSGEGLNNLIITKIIIRNKCNKCSINVQIFNQITEY